MCTSRFPHAVYTVLFCLLALLWSGCEEDVTAVLGTDVPFSMYGILSPEADTQWVRVFAVTETLEPERPAPLDARFTSVDVETGEERIWQDTVLQDVRGRYGHYFWSPVRAAHGHTYRMKVERSDGAATEADVRVPQKAGIVIDDPILGDPVIQPLLVDALVPRLMKIEVTYHVQFGRANDERATFTELTMPFSYDGKQHHSGEAWRIPVNLSWDYERIRRVLIERRLWHPSYGMALLGLKMDLRVVNEEWAPPDSVFDANVLVQPGTMSNVRNGFGFIGAGYRLTRSFLPTQEAQEKAGFTLRTQ